MDDLSWKTSYLFHILISANSPEIPCYTGKYNITIKIKLSRFYLEPGESTLNLDEKNYHTKDNGMQKSNR